MDAIILVGGLGTRLRSELGPMPKAMVSIAGRPFLERLLIHLSLSNVRSIVLAVSYGRELIEGHFNDGAAFGVSIQYCREAEPLGTAGALRNALPLIQKEHVLVMNGDSFLDVNYETLLRFHENHGEELTIVGVNRADCRDFGRLQVSGRYLTSFVEKDHSDGSHGYINGGIYVFNRTLVEKILPGVVQSLETRFFPSWLAAGNRIPAYLVSQYFIDFGTPGRLTQFRQDFAQGLVPLRGLSSERCAQPLTSNVDRKVTN